MIRFRWVLFYAVTAFIVLICAVSFYKEWGRVEQLSATLDKRMEEFVVVSRRSQELKEKIQYYKKAIEQGYFLSEFNLGDCYYKGDEVEKDLTLAAKWYEKAAAQNDERAQVNLAVLYAKGNGVEQDYRQAKSWYEKALSLNGKKYFTAPEKIRFSPNRQSSQTPSYASLALSFSMLHSALEEQTLLLIYGS